MISAPLSLSPSSLKIDWFHCKFSLPCLPFSFPVFWGGGFGISLTAPSPPLPSTALISFALISTFLNLRNKVSYTASCYLDAAVNKPATKLE